jgi:hypothetical protein
MKIHSFFPAGHLFPVNPQDGMEGLFVAFFGWFLTIIAVLALEPLDAPGRIYQLLLPGEEGVAERTDFDLYILMRRSGFYHVPAQACDSRLFVSRVDSLFHFPTPISCFSSPGGHSAAGC